MATLRLVMTFGIRFQAKTEEWSLGFNFQTGENPITGDLVGALQAALWTDVIRPTVSSNVTYRRFHGGELGQDAIHAQTFDAPATGTIAAKAEHPEVCYLMESKMGPRRYLRKWVHSGAFEGTVGDGSSFQTADRDTVNLKWVKLTDGTLPSGVKYCAPNGDLALAPFTADPILRTRQFRRRGKRPTPASG